MSLMPQGGAPKKDSIFSSIAPAQPAPAPMPAPAPAAAPRPAVDAEAVNALKTKIDALEKNIVAQLEKKLSAAPPAATHAAPPPPPAPPHQDQLLRKIEDLERRLSDSAALSASHMRNIEESKISARREIEDLLKAVREQQKYSELDRQMHDQLEKAWTRAEALEKKLMDFYSSVLELEARRKEDSSSASEKASAASEKAAASSERLAAALEALGARIERLERRAEESPLPALAEDIRRSQQEFMAKALREGDAMLAAQEEAGRDMLSNFRESASSLRDFFDNQFRRELTMLNERVAAENAALRREITASLEESRRLVREQGEAGAARTAEFGRLLESTRLKAESAEAALETSARRQALALEEFARRMDAELRAVNADFLAAARRDSEDRFSRFGAKYADALLAVTFIESFRAAVGGALDRLESHGSRMAAFLAHVPPGQLEKLLGVSGEMVRAQFEAMANASEGLKADIAALREIKRGIEEKVRGVFGEEK